MKSTLFIVTPDFSVQKSKEEAFNWFVKDNGGLFYLVFKKRREAWKQKAFLKKYYGINFQVAQVSDIYRYEVEHLVLARAKEVLDG
ncbi:MAG: hypothetical protein IKP65_07015 [Alphaproteobacteria bacterium]|nr:hypothetical protein [Alphaproteobacteria bacterium]